MPVQIIGKHESLSPGEYLKAIIEAGEKAGKTLVTVVPYFDEVCVVWAPGRKRDTHPAAERRG